MKKRLDSFAICIAVIVFSMAAVAGAQAQTIFSDNFDAGASPQWGNQRGNWLAAAGVYDAQLPNNSPLTYSGLPFVLTDFAVEVDINDVGDGGIWLRSDAAGQNGVVLITGGLGWGAGGGGGTSLYWHVISGGFGSGILNEATNVFTNPGDEDAHLRVTVVGDLYSVFVNGSAIPATTLTNTDFASGRVGLYDFSSQTFDNFTLMIVPEPSTWALLCVAAVPVLIGRAARRIESRR
jgi:hypothetical protein